MISKLWTTRNLFIGACLLLVLIVAIVLTPNRPTKLSQERIIELRVLYPTVNGFPGNITARSLSFEEVINNTDTVIVAEVVGSLPDYKLDIVNPGTPEYRLNEKQHDLGLPSYMPSFTPFEVRIDSIIKGKSVTSPINLIYNTDFNGFEPNLKPGMKIITAIKKPSQHPEGNYFFTKYGTYYIVDENYVLSAYETNDDEESRFGNQMNGSTVDVLIDEITKLK